MVVNSVTLLLFPLPDLLKKGLHVDITDPLLDQGSCPAAPGVTQASWPQQLSYSQAPLHPAPELVGEARVGVNGVWLLGRLQADAGVRASPPRTITNFLVAGSDEGSGGWGRRGWTWLCRVRMWWEPQESSCLRLSSTGIQMFHRAQRFHTDSGDKTGPSA